MHFHFDKESAIPGSRAGPEDPLRLEGRRRGWREAEDPRHGLSRRRVVKVMEPGKRRALVVCYENCGGQKS
jgi:hypothetical protein